MNLHYNKQDLAFKSLPGRYSPGTKVSAKCKNSTNQLEGPKEMLCTDEGSWEGYTKGISCGNTLHFVFISSFMMRLVLITFSSTSIQ